MKHNNVLNLVGSILMAVCLSFSIPAKADPLTVLPVDYPILVITNNGAVSPGNLIGNIAGRSADKTTTYYVVLDSTGTNVLYANKTNTLWRFGTPQGFNAAASAGSFRFKDETWTVVESATTVGYTLDNHDVKLLPNGHAFVFAKETRIFDMSGVVAGGNTAASIQGDVVQEVDAYNRLVFEWHSFDHIAITNTFASMTQASFDYAHVNAMAIDPIDNNLLISLRTTSEIVKVNRQTGQVIWRLGGKNNMFTFINEHAENAPFYTVGQHDVHRLANGNLLFFDNGNIQGGGTTPNDRTYSRAVEYALDEVLMTATLVWEFRHTPDISAGCTGSLKRMPNGNTLIDWGCAVPNSGVIVTEVNPEGEVVMEMKHWTNSGIGSILLGGGLTKQTWDSADLVRSAGFSGVQVSQSYTATIAGVTVSLMDLSASQDNTLVVERHMDAVRLPEFEGKAPQVTMEHIILSGTNINALAARIELNLPDTNYVFDTPKVNDPSLVTVYGRPVPGQGQFTALPTSYNPGTQKLQVNTTSLGEFIFAVPEITETNYTPVILSPPDQSQFAFAGSGPVTLSWQPRGRVGSFELQVAANPEFSDLLLSTNGLGVNNFAVPGLSANTLYFWRVRAVGEGVAGEWANASFTLVPAFIQVTFPAGGEIWVRNQTVTIQWQDNISENVLMDLYLNGVSNRTFTSSSVASSGSWNWRVAQFQAVTESTNYTIRIRSASNPSIFSFSQPFTIVNSNRLVTLASVPPGLTVTVDGTNCSTPTNFNWLPFAAHTLEITSPQVAGDGHSRYLFSSWSDEGARNHSYTVPFSPRVTNTATFATSYLLEVASTPPEAGNVVTNPVGPWFDVGQVVSLTALAKEGYVFYDWQGIDSQLTNTAQITMNGYKSVQAKFIPVSGVPFIDPASVLRLDDGRLRFNFTAGAGLASQARVWVTPTLLPADWQLAATVPLTGSNGVFTNSTPSTNDTLFFRITLP